MKVIYQTAFIRDIKKCPKMLLADLDNILLRLETDTSLDKTIQIKNLKVINQHSELE